MQEEKTLKKPRRPGKFRIRYVILIIIILLSGWEVKRLFDSQKYFKTGQDLYSRGMTEDAIENFEAASKLNIWSQKVFINLAIAYNKQDLYIKAYDAAKRAFELKPEDENALIVFGQSCFNLARNESKRANYTGARKYYRAGIEAEKKALLKKYIPDAVYYIANAYLCLGEYEEGILFLRDKIPFNEQTQEQIDLLMQAKKNLLSGSVIKDIPYAVRKMLPQGASIVVAGHPFLKFADTETIDFKTGFFERDLDEDRKNEIVIIYNIPVADTMQTPVYLSILKQNHGRWNLWWGTKISDYGAGYFEVSDINADTKPEILVEALHDEKSGALINIFVWDGSGFKTLQQIGPSWGTNVLDIDNDGTKEIIILDRKGQEYISAIYKWDGVKYIKTE